MADRQDQRESAFQKKASVACSSGILSSECANVWFVGLWKACCLQFQVWLVENVILIHSLFCWLFMMCWGLPGFRGLLESCLYGCPRHHEWSSSLWFMEPLSERCWSFSRGGILISENVFSDRLSRSFGSSSSGIALGLCEKELLRMPF